MAVVAVGVHGGGRHGVDGVAADQLLHIERVGVGLVLHAGAGPQQALRHRAGGGQRLPALAAGQLDIVLVGQLGIGDGDLAAQALEVLHIGAADLHAVVDLLVDLAVDAADEEAGDAGDPADVAALRLEVFQPGDERLGHVLVGLLAEQQGHVDVHALADQRLDCGRAFGRAGHLDHQVVAPDQLPQPARLGDRVLGAQRQIGRDFERDVAVHLVGRVVDRAQQVGRVLDVLDGERLVDGLRVQVALGRQLLEARVVVGAVAHRLLEDRRVGRHALQPVALDQGLQAAILEELALNEVEPRRLAELLERLQRVGRLGLHVHAGSP